MADVKTLLKEARKLIEDKNFVEAQVCCKKILNLDKKNYLALVLLGKALQHSDVAPAVYQKAISTKPDHPLAWQGLAHYYEHDDDNSSKTKLFLIYDKILQLEIEEDKALEIITKLSQLSSSSKNNEAVGVFANFILRSSNENLINAAEQSLLELLNAGILCKEDDISTVLSVFDKSLKNNPNTSLELQYGKVILLKTPFSSAAEELINMPFFSTNIMLKEYLCIVLCKKFVEENSFSNLDVESHMDKITEGLESSKYPVLLRSIISYSKCQYLEAYKEYLPLLRMRTEDVIEITFIIKCTIMLKMWSITQKLSTHFLITVKDEKFALDLKKYLFLSLTKEKKWKQAISVIKSIPMKCLNEDEIALLAECKIEANEPVDDILPGLHSTQYCTQIQALILLKQEKYIETVKLLEDSVNNFLNLLYLGKAYWHLNQYDECLKNLLKAAKLNPDYADTFLYLGHYNFHHKQDYGKAKKCYEMAYRLNETDNDTIKNLSDVYAKLELRETDFELLKAVDKYENSNQLWVNFRLGIHHYSRRDFESAIVNFRKVIRGNEGDASAFECLADSYYRRGSYGAALKAYTKAIALLQSESPSETKHSLTKIGYIHSLYTNYDDAVALFDRVLQLDPYFPLALKGMAETWLRIAKKRVETKRYGSARDCAQKVVDYISRALLKRKPYSCLLKLLGDTLMFVTKLPKAYAYVYMKKSLNNIGEDNNVLKREIIDIYPIATSVYAHVAKRKQQLTSLDLASTYFAFYVETRSLAHWHVSFSFTMSCIKLCLKGKAFQYRYWNLLGKLFAFVKKYNIAQHCFVKSVLATHDGSVPKLWSNLGALYTKLSLYRKANYCFFRGQSSKQSHPESWLGQGLLAEVLREEEAMDLFRHAAKLGFHAVSALAYADWVCRTLRDVNYKQVPDSKYNIDDLFAIPRAMDLLKWYTYFNPGSAGAFTMLGVLQERSAHIQAAFTSFEKALHLVNKNRKNIALLNMGRILIRIGNYDEAINMYTAITEASLNSTSGLALALYKKGMYEESYAAYDTALQWLCESDEQKADVLVAMASIVYKFKGPEEAKTILFHSIQLLPKQPTPFSLFALCALGLIHSDKNLSKLALSGLQQYEKDKKFGFDIGYLKSYQLVCQENIKQAMKSLYKSVHNHPGEALLWLFIAQLCLQAFDKGSRFERVVGSSALRACRCAHYSDFVQFNKFNASMTIAAASVIAHRRGKHTEALRVAKKCLHLYPNEAAVWAALVVALSTDNKWRGREDWLGSATTYMRRRADLTT